MSPYLCHFVKRGEFVQPIEVLKKILKENRLITKRPDFVSYTESPLHFRMDKDSLFR